MYGPMITSEAPMAFTGAGTHSNNTTEMTAMIEALCLGPMVLLRVMQTRAFFMTLNMPQVFVWARFRPVRTSNSRLHANYQCSKSSIGHA